MIPVALDPSLLRIAVAGNGAIALRRFIALRAAGGVDCLFFADQPTADIVAEAGAYLRPYLPQAADLAELNILWVVDIADDVAAGLAQAARAAKVIVNVEDRLPFCDFHSVSEIRRGDLLITVSTNGRAAGLARRIRLTLENAFGPVWAERIERVAALRKVWKSEGLSMAEASARIEDLVAHENWLGCSKDNCPIFQKAQLNV
jgi:precorrin-2 dehydrogenase/sirohydrochlorin ferrochelatase